MTQALDALQNRSVLVPGVQLGSYRVLSVLGQGGTAQVYRAQDLTLEREVALKVMHAHIQHQPGFAEHFLAEARALAAIDHPHVLRIYSAGEHDGLLWMALEIIDGADCAAHLAKHGPFAPEAALAIIRACTQGLSALEAAGFIHRDIKPHNIFLTRSGQAKLGDLGLVRQTASSAPTLTGSIAGTPAFMSPEQVRGETLDTRSDLHAIGATLYTLLTGEAPFRGSSVYALCEQVVNTPPPRLAARWPHLQPLDVLVQACMAKDPDLRPNHCADLLQRLEACAQALGFPAQQTIAVSKAVPQKTRGNLFPRSRARLFALCVASLTLLALLLVLLRSPAQTTSPQVNTITSANSQPQGAWVLNHGRDNLGPWLRVTVRGVEQRFRRLDPQKAEIGSPSQEVGRSRDENRLTVELNEPVWIAETECTRAFWAALTNQPQPEQEQYPQTSVSYTDIIKVLETITPQFPPGLRLRLPTEVEWELAARAGNPAAYSFGNEAGHLIGFGNFADKGSGFAWADGILSDGHAGLAKVASYQPNALGLYDVHGNVWEWCADFYRSTRSLDSLGKLQNAETANRVRRGGAYDERARDCRSASRQGSGPNTQRPNIGLRWAAEWEPLEANAPVP